MTGSDNPIERLLTSLVVLTVFVDGFIKPHQPGSLREPAKTYLFPKHLGTIPLSFGLLMCKRLL